MARYFSISDQTAEAAGFPSPMHGARVRDRNGRIWTYRADARDGLSDLSGSWVAPVIGGGGAIGGGIWTALGIGGKFAGPIGAGIGVISSLIASIFAQHAAKVQREDEISGAWAASGPAAIKAVMDANRSGQISASEAATALAQIQQQFYAMTQPITKYKGRFGAFPDANGPRPADSCNWACGTSWDLNQQIQTLKGQLVSGGGGLNLGALTSDPIMLGGLLVIGFLLLGGGKRGRR